MLLVSLAALAFAHILPGLCLVKLLDLGRCREDRFVMAAVLGGPLSALAYLGSLVSGTTLAYWIPAALVAIAGLILPFRSRPVSSWPRRSLLFMAVVLASVTAAYFATTGSLYRVDGSGTLLLDQALQRDALFHVGIVRSLETSHPPTLLSVSGVEIGYHVGYHLQLALWSRFFGIEPMDGLIRVGAFWSMALYLLSAYLLARRFTENETARLLTAVLVFGSGLGFLFFSRPSVDWWSLAFMDWGLVSIFLANPLLPALALLFVGLSLLHDYTETRVRGMLLASVFALGYLFSVKMFLGAQVIAAIALASLLRPREKEGWVALGALTLVSSPLLVQTLLAASGSNTSVGLRPLELVRYSMEKLDWADAVSALADVGRFESFDALVIAAFFLWLFGFLGLRVLGVGSTWTSLRSETFLSRAMAAFVIIGFPLSLLLRIAPAESEGLSRLESLNDAGWFVTQSGVLLWFFTARAVSRWRPVFAVAAVVSLALPATIQHFLYAASLDPDRIGKSRIEAASQAASISSPEDVWVDTPDRVRPSLLAYLSGRPVVYDSYVGYDYMFVGRDELDYRRHALAQFWSSEDPAYLAWFLDHFGVDFVWREGRELPGALQSLVDREFANSDVELFRVRRAAVVEGLELPIASVGMIPSGGRGLPHFSAGFGRPERRSLSSETATLYVPLERGLPVEVTLELAEPPEEGELRIDDVPFVTDSATNHIVIVLPPRDERGLVALEVVWAGKKDLIFNSVGILTKEP